MKIHQEELTTGEDSSYWVKQYEQLQFTSPRHYHHEYELAYIRSGAGKLFIGNAVHPFKAGDVFLFAPALIHAFKNSPAPDMKMASCRVILFRKNFFGDRFLLRREAAPLRRMLEEAKEGIYFAEPSSDLIQAIEDLPEEISLYGVCNFLQLLDLLIRQQNTRTLARKWFRKHYYVRDEEKTHRILYHIHANLHTITFRKAAGFAGLGSVSFARMFKNKTERTFSEYVNEARIRRAQELLVDSSLTVHEISQSCGYRNLSYFNRVFKKINHITPLQYRQNFQL